MKKVFLLAAMATLIVALPNSAAAHDYDRDDDGHWLRYVAYVLHPIGYALETYVARPIHNFITATEDREIWFGHDHPNDDHEHAVEVAAVVPEPEPVIPEPTPPPVQATPEPTPEATPEPEPEFKEILTELEPEPITPQPETPRVIKLWTINFDYDEATIKDDQTYKIDSNLRYLADNPDLRVLIEGHCDERGTAEYNYELGQRRAVSVRDYFVSGGVDESRIEIVSKGKEQPIIIGSGEESWSQNRRCEIKFVD